MANELIVPHHQSDDQFNYFNFEGSNVRIMKDDNGDPWFVAADVCKVLRIANNRNATARLDDDEKGVRQMDTPGGKQELTIVNESGLYSLILRSGKPEAKVFKRWITHEVIPSIRKSGQYALKPKSLAEQALIHAQALVDHENRLAEHDQRLIMLESRVQREPDEHSIIGYCNMHRIAIDLRSAQTAGIQARRLSLERGLPIGKVADPRFGEVNTYKDEILDEVFAGDDE